MQITRPLYLIWHRLVPALALWVLAGFALAQQQMEPAARIARLDHMEGAVVFSPAGDDEWTPAQLNRPLTTGDRIWNDRGSRSELHLGNASMRMDGQTRLDIVTLDDSATLLTVLQGSLRVQLRSLASGESFEINTPNLAFRAAQPGDYRLDVDPQSGVTRVTVLAGSAAVYGDAGEVGQLGARQQIAFSGRGLSQVAGLQLPRGDDFDAWVGARERTAQQSVSAQYVPRDLPGIQQLDVYGSWTNEPTYGPVWFPRAVATDWAPFRNGRWEWIAPWGWTWIDNAPWGFAPSHYGRWARIGPRWGWVPGHIAQRPAYAPALVAYAGRNGGANWNAHPGPGRPARTVPPPWVIGPQGAGRPFVGTVNPARVDAPWKPTVPAAPGIQRGTTQRERLIRERDHSQADLDRRDAFQSEQARLERALREHPVRQQPAQERMLREQQQTLPPPQAQPRHGRETGDPRTREGAGQGQPNAGWPQRKWPQAISVEKSRQEKSPQVRSLQSPAPVGKTEAPEQGRGHGSRERG